MAYKLTLFLARASCSTQGGWLRLAPFAFRTTLFPCVFWATDFFLPENCRIQKKEPRTNMEIINVGVPFGENCPSFQNVRQNSRWFHISHRHTTLTHDTSSMHHSFVCLTTQVLPIFSLREWTVPHKNSSMSRRWQHTA